MTAFSETAFAKINLALHVRRRREDGYHDIETLFAFVNAGDEVSAQIADADSLTIEGEFAAGLSNGADNLVLQALEIMRSMAAVEDLKIPPLAIRLIKNLPVAAGIGGGSADAAAMIRMVDRHFLQWGDVDRLVLATRELGADIGACIVSQTRIGTGLGWELECPETNDLEGMPVLLVNPRTALPTGPVFKAWDGHDRGGLPHGSALAIGQSGRNDLETAAISLCPEVSTILGVLKDTQAQLARMSGSGATCFALYDNVEKRDVAREEIGLNHPEWWTLAGTLR